jgi:hypothetical protein
MGTLEGAATRRIFAAINYKILNPNNVKDCCTFPKAKELS